MRLIGHGYYCKISCNFNFVPLGEPTHPHMFPLYASVPDIECRLPPKCEFTSVSPAVKVRPKPRLKPSAS